METSKKFAVILSGCGVYDGAEIHEATLTLYFLLKNNCTYQIFAPDKKMYHVINHLTGEEVNETRNVLIEAARIARGNIKALRELNIQEFDAVIFPGGFGAAKNFSDFAFKGADCTVDEEIANTIKNIVKLKKPVAALCVTPVLFANVLNDVKITLGMDKGAADAVVKMGAKHLTNNYNEITVDTKYKIVTTPCYMLDVNILQIAEGIEKAIKATIDLIE